MKDGSGYQDRALVCNASLINHFLNGKNKKAIHYHKRLAVDATDKVRGKVYKFIVYASNIAFCQ